MGLLPFEEIRRKVLIKKDSKTNESIGCYPDKRSVPELIKYGIINLNKPAGPTSHQVSDYVQGILGISKAGHSGTLDPGVTGCLPIALDKARRVVQMLLKAGKEYVCLMHFHKDVSEEQIKKSSINFIGKIKQIPPVRSAVKRQLRERKVYYLEILEIDGRDILFVIGCEAGTYIRKLVHDWGKKLGGAHMAQLVRTKAGPFNDKSWMSLHDLKDAYEYYKQGDESKIRKVILPFERGVDHLPKVWVFDSAVDTLCHGSDLYLGGVSKLESNIKKEDLVAVMSLKDELICIGNASLNSEEILEKDDGEAIKCTKVFMERGIYGKNKSE